MHQGFKQREHLDSSSGLHKPKAEAQRKLNHCHRNNNNYNNNSCFYLLASLYGRHCSKHLKCIGSQKPYKVGLLFSFPFTMRKTRHREGYSVAQLKSRAKIWTQAFICVELSAGRGLAPLIPTVAPWVATVLRGPVPGPYLAPILMYQSTRFIAELEIVPHGLRQL